MNPRTQSARAPGVGRIGSKWASADSGQDYAETRFGTRRAGERDPRAIASLLERWAPDAAQASLLDLPSGAGRLEAALRAKVARYVGVDISSSMLAAARLASPAAELFRGSASCLPFGDRSFDIVVCNRLLHHLEQPALGRVVRELARVSSGLVIASFWDAASFPAWRRRAGLRRGKADSRIPVSRKELAAAFEEGGASVVAWHNGLRFMRMQSFVVARRA
ncbi:MAG: putative TPR repeat methyltransferase [Chlamydiales bacterium]|jgi:predicted TPR repeat methyltransferase